jgi:hypothetical protein
MTASQAMTSAGTLVYISATAPGAYTEAGWLAISEGDWKEIGEVVTIPDYGVQYKVINHNPIGNRKTVKRKGSYDEGQVALTMARASSDVGQALCITARGSDTSYSFRIITGYMKQYFSAQVTSYTSNRGGVDSILMATVNLAIDGAVIDSIENIIQGNDVTFAGSSNWANVDINAYDETTGGKLTITASAAEQYCTLPVANATTVSGHRYRVWGDVTNIVATWDLTNFTGSQLLGIISANGRFCFDFTASTTGGFRIRSNANNSSAKFDNIVLVEID